MYWQCDQPKELCLLPADPRLCFIENRLGRNARELIYLFFFIFGAFAAKGKFLRQHIFVLSGFFIMRFFFQKCKVEQISECLFTYLVVTQCLTRKVDAGMFCPFADGEMCSGF